MNISAAFIHRPIATAMLMAAILLLGLIGYELLPVAALPNVDSPTILVTAQLPGADAQTVAGTVTTPLERQFGQIAGLTQMTSSSATEYAQITLQFDRGRTVDSAAQDVQAAINAAAGQLPPTMPNPPIYRKTNPADTPVLMLAMTSETLPLTKVSDYASSILAQKISQMPGVGEVDVGGMQNPAIRVQVNPAQGLDLEAVRTALATATVDQPKGTLNGANQAFALQTNDQLMTAEGFNNYILANRSDTFGASGPVRVRDVGRAIVAPQDVNLAGWMNTEPAIIIAVQRQSGANVIATVEGFTPARSLAAAVDQDPYRIGPHPDHPGQRRRCSAYIAADGGAGRRRHLSFFAQALGDGDPGDLGADVADRHVCDDVCVRLQPRQSVADGADDRRRLCRRRCDRHDREHRAAHRGGEDADAGCAQRGRRDRFHDPLDLDLADRGLHSAVSDERHRRPIVPRVCRHRRGGDCRLRHRLADSHSDDVRPRVDGREQNAPRGHFAGVRALFDALAALYDRGLVVALQHRFVTLLVMISTVAATLVLFVEIPKGFFPQQDTGLIVGIAEAAQNISPQAMKDRMRAVLAVVTKDPSVAAANAYIGPGGPTVTENDGRLFITLKPLGERTESADQVIARLNKTLQPVWGVTLYMQAAQDITIGARLSKTQYQYTLVDVDSDELDHWAPILLEKLRTLPQLTDVASDQQSTGRVLKVEVNRELAQQLGINPSVVDSILYDAFGQRVASRIYTRLNQYFVILEVEPDFQLGPNALSRIYATSSSGAEVPLSEFAAITSTVAPIAVNHQGQFPSVTLSFNLPPKVSIGNALTAIQQATRELHLPPSIATSFQGSAQAFQNSLSSTPILILAALIAVYIILGMLYESTIHPITIISTLPSAGLGALLTLILFGMPLDVIGIIGIILLIGIVKKNGIMLVDFALAGQRERGSAPRRRSTRPAACAFARS
jgi:multidrug efflux pump subunit AcrB